VKTEQNKALKSGGFKNRLFQVKIVAAIVAGKIMIYLTRFLGRGGTTLPGRTALIINPGVTSFLAGQLKAGTLIVTGTNGKTTTSALITGILKARGLRCIHNQSGSNMDWGVTSALAAAATWCGKISADWALMEVDEGAFPNVVQMIRPVGIVATNVFRDQLDRYGEIDQIQDSISRGMANQPEGGFLAINADDPSLVSLAGVEGNKRLTYGLEIEMSADNFQNTGRDLKTCPHCKTELIYNKIYFAHLGHYRCPACSFKRPRPDVRLTNLTAKPDGSDLLEIKAVEETILLTSPLPGTYNLYNLLAALTCALALKIPVSFAAEILENASPSFGRMEVFELDNKKLIIALIKNPVGANEVLRTILARSDHCGLLVAINDKIADGTDVSWLWDVDFEQLAQHREALTTVSVSGLRAWEMAVRFKYAGFNPQQVSIKENTGLALLHALKTTPFGGTLFVLPTYTAMLEIRNHLNRMGIGKKYWEDLS
jgi:lipid II isoglutaminyl synthase (glutamine-hydrolysing)